MSKGHHPRTRRRSRTIRATLGVVFAATLTVGGISVAATMHTLRAQRYSAPVTNLLGEGRLLVDRIVEGVDDALAADSTGIDNDRIAAELQALASDVIETLDEATLAFNRTTEDRVERLKLLQIILLVTGGLTIIIGIRLLQTDIARPVATLTTAVNRMREGDLETPIQLDTPNELGQLADIFDAMRRDVHRRIEEEALLASLSRRLLEDLEPEAIAEAILLTVQEWTGIDRSAFLIPDNEGKARALAVQGWSSEFWDEAEITIYPPESSGIAWAIHSCDPLLIDLARTDHPFTIPEVMHREGVATALIIPVVRADRSPGTGYDQVYGVLAVHSFEERTFSPEEVEFLSLLTRYAALALERARIHQAQLLAELRYRALFNQTFQFIGLLTPDGIVLDVNDTVLQSAHATRGDVVGKPFWETRWWKHNPELQDQLRRAIGAAAKGEFVRFEALHPGRDGTMGAIDFSLKPIHDDQGKVVFLLPEGRDISERKRAEDALRHSEQRFHGVVSLAAEAIIMMGADHRITFFNHGAEKIFGYESDEIVGQPINTLIPERFHSAHGKDIQGFARSAVSSREMGERGEVWGRRKDGEEFSAEASISRLDLDGEKIFTVVLRDVSEREALEAQLSRTRQLASIGTLTGGLAHHFNNALTTIRGHTELLLAECESPQWRKDLEQIRDSSREAATITRQLLVFSGLQVDQPRIIDLPTVVRRAEPLLRSIVREDMRLELIPATGPLEIHADPGQINQVLVNLVTNARDAMPSGGTIEIDTILRVIETADLEGSGLTRPGEYVVLQVRDTGTGMDEETMARAFEPFFTTRSIASWSGLGLSTIYGIAQRAGGGVKISSTPGTGTTIEVLIPLASSDPTEGPDTSRVTSEQDVREDLATTQVLIVEDEPGVRTLIRRVLQRAGLEVLEAESGEEALTLCETNNPREIDLVITDVIMPGMSGPELAREVRNLCPEVPVLFISGYSRENLSDHATLESGVPFLEKPFAPDALMEKVRELIAKQTR